MTTITTATILNYILIPLGSALVGAVLKHLYTQASSSSQPATQTGAGTSNSATPAPPSAIGELEQLAMAIGQQALSQLASAVQGAATAATQPAATPASATTPAAEPSTPIRRHPILSAIHNLLSNPATTPETAAPAVQALASQLPKN